MARPRKGEHENDLRLTQRLCHLIKAQSGMTPQQLEELFGFGAISPTSKNNNARTGKSFRRYLDGERAMSIDLMQSVLEKASQQTWWILDICPTTGMLMHGVFGSRSVQLNDVEKITAKAAEKNGLAPTPEESQMMLGTLTQILGDKSSGDRLSDTLEKMRLEKESFQKNKEQLMKSISEFLTRAQTLEHGIIGRTDDSDPEDTIFTEMSEDRIEYELNNILDKLGQYRIEFTNKL